MAEAALKKGGQPGSNNGNWRGGVQTKTCLECGLPFSAPRWEMKHRKYCCRDCGDKAKIIANSRKTRPHVHVIERIIGHRISNKTVIHHINGDKKDNRPENLFICENQAHHLRIHAAKRIIDAGGNPDTDKICSRCKIVKPKSDFHIAKRADGYRCYCKSCQSKRYYEGRSLNEHSVAAC
jgi:DNA-directed RNA polymerase subunit RPC12/RpoP